MNHKFLLLLLFAGMVLSLSAQQTSESFVAKGGGQQQVFLLEDNPRLTVTIQNGEPVFTVRDLRNRVMNGVTTCIFQVSDEPISTATPSIANDAKDKPKKYIRNGMLYIERNGVRYNTQGQVIDKKEMDEIQ